MKKQSSFISLILLFALSACSEQVQEKMAKKVVEKSIDAVTGFETKILDPNTPMPEQPPAPNFLIDEEIKNKIAENQEYINSKIVKKDGETVYYFQEEKQKDDKTIYTLTDDKNQAKYYRVVLGKTAENYCVVQDFYTNGEKRREPYIIVDTDCTQFSDKDNTYINQIRDYLTLVSYRPQEKIKSITLVNHQNKTVTSYFYSSSNEKNSLMVHNDFNANKMQMFFFNNKKEIQNTNIFSFNDKQMIEYIGIANVPYKEDKNETSVELARTYTNIDLANYTVEVTYWNKKDNGDKSVTKITMTNTKMDIDSMMNFLKSQHQNFIKTKKLIDKK